ncbi:MAG: mercury resistance system transport protein MerF [Rhodospirillaceae bacterium]|jgi:mercuric ion transport protein|nr:mercury resistance system transport protein MerF [Rhodospirillaceae bacterium]MBT5244195.1 mercury resistance system transport protein MerF [Rhodospirillaceae bacterium]MBT5561720.1 mercury resistance system transport protein MerF [Rhodospirillaceae bacterium]MBT6243159.1 mercury resistance system transport protein MerF [Rhodospirillaceae bacterium]MBT7137448.1 mercury resistance system transport protein MerF [Rhodospirillaceae bacterium]
MKNRTLIKTGVIGSVISMLCCFTPLLVVLLGGVGLSAWLGWLDYLLLPALVAFLALTGFGLWRLKSS